MLIRMHLDIKTVDPHTRTDRPDHHQIITAPSSRLSTIFEHHLIPSIGPSLKLRSPLYARNEHPIERVASRWWPSSSSSSPIECIVWYIYKAYFDLFSCRQQCSVLHVPDVAVVHFCANLRLLQLHRFNFLNFGESVYGFFMKVKSITGVHFRRPFYWFVVWFDMLLLNIRVNF